MHDDGLVSKDESVSAMDDLVMCLSFVMGCDGWIQQMMESISRRIGDEERRVTSIELELVLVEVVD